jgi:hypothetical protein
VAGVKSDGEAGRDEILALCSRFPTASDSSELASSESEAEPDNESSRPENAR